MLRRARRLVLLAASGCILVIWLICVLMWGRSYWRGDVVAVVSTGDDSRARESVHPLYHSRSLAIVSGRGGICLAYRHAARFTKAFDSAGKWVVFKTPAYPKPSAPAVIAAVPAAFLVSPRGKVDAISIPPQRVRSTENLAPPRNFRGENPLATDPSIDPRPPFRGPAPVAAAAAAAAPALPSDAIPLPPEGRAPSRFMVYEAGLPIGKILPTGDHARVLILPYWMLLLPMTLLAILPAWHVLRVIQQRSIGPGCCRHCGYDLRATPERCPECGTVVDSTVSRGTS